MPLTPGTRLGQYEVISALGRGGMGEVYRARDIRLERDVAVKIKFFADTPTKFLIYSRNPEATLNDNLSKLLGDLYAEKPGLRQRIRGFGMTDHGPPRWINSASGAELKLVVKEILQLR